MVFVQVHGTIGVDLTRLASLSETGRPESNA
jgi:hypothetical protein